MKIEVTKDEVWEWIKGYEGLYLVSNRGRLLSYHKSKEGIILSSTDKTGGYLSHILVDKDGKRSTKRVHVLVAEAFIGTIPPKHEIHHKDGNKQNNNVSNLEIIRKSNHRKLTISEHPECIKAMNHYNQYIRPKPIMQFDLNGELVGKYANAKIASRMTGVCARNILQVASKAPYNSKGSIRKQAGGYIWKFKEESEVMQCED